MKQYTAPKQHMPRQGYSVVNNIGRSTPKFSTEPCAELLTLFYLFVSFLLISQQIPWLTEAYINRHIMLALSTTRNLTSIVIRVDNSWLRFYCSCCWQNNAWISVRCSWSDWIVCWICVLYYFSVSECSSSTETKENPHWNSPLRTWFRVTHYHVGFENQSSRNN